MRDDALDDQQNLVERVEITAAKWHHLLKERGEFLYVKD